ncbi:hypothetical protein PVK06_023534 [Gossypium arboreum]|uniref:Uncharacterized protein n=1 Tax=Gossypium arboreum TaxID=29729 RepID=A0ABR0PBM7_GOSAR|nr:hypothetical protein PVK06_023534 [Gossypium arboreum]
MDGSVSRFDNNHIPVTQLAMAFIHNLGEPPIPEIRGYLQEVVFLHASHMQGGCKLDPTLIRKMEAWNTHFPPSMRQVYNHTRGRSVTAQSAGGWVSHHGIAGSSRES